jgi:hypothetical protein
VANGRTQVGEKTELPSQAENCLLGSQSPLKPVVFPVADGAKQHGIGRFGQSERRGRQRMAMHIKCGPAHQGGLRFMA